MNREKFSPLVSIITPTRNRKHFLENTADHLKGQEYQNWEWIIIDDGSKDGTIEFLVNLEKKDSRIKFQPRSETHLQGPAGCRNQAVDIAKGNYVVFVDDDDIIHPEMLSLCIPFFSAYPEAAFLRFDKQPFIEKLDENLLRRNEDIAENPRVFRTSDIEKMISGEVPFACCTVIWKRQNLENDRFDESLSYAEEWEYYSRLILKADYGLSLNRVLYFNRKHASSNTGEFWANDPIRRDSKVEATKKIIFNLKEHNLLNAALFQFFIRLGFFLKSYEIIQEVLDKAEASTTDMIKYKLGFFLYPILRPVFRLKGKFLTN